MSANLPASGGPMCPNCRVTDGHTRECLQGYVYPSPISPPGFLWPQIPGKNVQHQWITPECRANHTAQGAFDEAVERTRKMYERLANSENYQRATFHLVLNVERE